MTLRHASGSLAALGAAGALILPAPRASAQSFPTADPVLRALWAEGIENSHAESLAQALMDSIGPRLTGSPESGRAVAWAVELLARWGVDSRSESYGTWLSWERGVAHVDLLEPRVRTLVASLMAWSPGTAGPVEGGVIALPQVNRPETFAAWLPLARGQFVLLAPPEPYCRPEASFGDHAGSAAADAVRRRRETGRAAWREGLKRTGLDRQELLDALEGAGAAGILWSEWSSSWGANRRFALGTRFEAATRTVPALDLDCEDYGLLARLVRNGQGPRLRVDARARALGELPVANVIGAIRGAELPDEYVLLSAHLDSWDGASGATDNGTGVVTMLEALRLLAKAAPRPRRTILVGLWAGEEQGLNGSRAFARDHPDVVDGLQAVFNQDSGTGHIASVSMLGLTRAGEHFARWLSQIPPELTAGIRLALPGAPGPGGSDYAAFNCAGAPTFALASEEWDYSSYTWHTNLDTFDKIVPEAVAANATLVAMLAYLAGQDERVPRDRRILPVDARTEDVGSWPECRDGDRQTPELLH